MLLYSYTPNYNLCMQEENRTNKSNKIADFQIHTKPTLYREPVQFTWKQSTVGITQTPQT